MKISLEFMRLTLCLPTEDSFQVQEFIEGAPRLPLGIPSEFSVHKFQAFSEARFNREANQVASDLYNYNELVFFSMVLIFDDENFDETVTFTNNKIICMSTPQIRFRAKLTTVVK